MLKYAKKREASRKALRQNAFSGKRGADPERRVVLRGKDSVKKTAFAAKLALALTSAIWGAGFVFSQAALDAGFGPAGLMLVKFAVASLVTGVIFRGTIRRGFSLAAFRRAAPVGVILALSFLAQTLGLKLSTPSNNALITAAYVVITPFLWKLVFKRRLPRSAYFASLVCFIGVAALSLDLYGGVSFRAGDLWTLVCAVLFAAQMVATESLVGEMDYGLLLFIEIFTAALTTLALSLLAWVIATAAPAVSGALAPLLITRGDFAALRTPVGAVSAAFLGILSTGLCYVMQTSAQRYISSGAAAIILSMEALFGAVFSVAVGYDALSLRLVLGGGLILSSVVLGASADVRAPVQIKSVHGDVTADP